MQLKPIIFTMAVIPLMETTEFVAPNNFGTPQFPDYIMPNLKEHNFCIYQNPVKGDPVPALCIHSDDAKVDVKAATNLKSLYINSKAVIDADGRWVSDPSGLKGDKGDPGPKGSFSKCTAKTEQADSSSLKVSCNQGTILTGGGCWCGASGIISMSMSLPLSSNADSWYCKCLQLGKDGNLENGAQVQTQVICCDQ